LGALTWLGHWCSKYFECEMDYSKRRFFVPIARGASQKSAGSGLPFRTFSQQSDRFGPARNAVH
jgi:hypothetical protein